MVPHYEVDMYQGSDWTPKLNWLGGGLFRAPIEEIDPGYPTKIQVTAHGLPSNEALPLIVSGVEGMEILNSKELAIMRASYVDANHFTLPISTVACEWIVGTGEVTYHKPTDISSMSFRGTLRARVHKGTALAELTTANGKIIDTHDDAGIQLKLTAAETALLNFTQAYINVEAVASPGGEVYPVFSLTVNLVRESTR